MIDLTRIFKDAHTRREDWDYTSASQLAERLATLRPGLRSSSDPNGFWCSVTDGRRYQAVVYTLVPVVFVMDEFPEARVELQAHDGVQVAAMVRDDDAYRIDRAVAVDVFPYPPEELNLELDSFSIDDLIFETAS